MAKKTAIQFDQELDKLYQSRTAVLRHLVRKPSGRSLSFSQAKRRKAEESLKGIYSRARGPSAFRQHFRSGGVQKKQWHPKRGKGWGTDDRKRNFKIWYGDNIRDNNCIYIFWAGKRCMYVGRTVRGRGRPQQHFEKGWFARVTRIDIYATGSPSEIPRLECIAIHNFDPIKNKRKASKAKWTKKCTICKGLKTIERELQQIFGQRRRRR